MTMKKFLTILFLLAFAAGCEKEDLLLSERDKIEEYLVKSRQMVEKSNVGSVIVKNPAFYEIFGRFAYRHIVNYYDEGREDRAVIGMGDKIELTFFNAYTFTGSDPKQSEIYWSNVPEIISSIDNKTSGNTLDWPSEPLTITLGETEILEGLEVSLPGCRDADSVQVYMTSNLAYGKQVIGNVPKNSMVAWYMKIKKITE